MSAAVEVDSSASDAGGMGGGSVEPGAGGGAGGVGSAVDWRSEHLDSDMRNDPTLSRFKSVPDLARSYLEARKKIGQQGIVPPGEDADESAWGEFYNALGRPEDPNGYQLGDFQPPEGVNWDNNVQGALLGVMHQAGMNNHQVNTVLRAYAGMVDQAFQHQAEQNRVAEEQAVASLRERWGGAFEKNEELATAAAVQILGDQGEAYANHVGPNGVRLGSDPVFLELLARAGQSGAEHGSLKGHSPRRHSMTPEEATRKHDDLLRDPNFSERVRSGDRSAIEELTNLNRYITGVYE